jgi:hypothetical protein
MQGVSPENSSVTVLNIYKNKDDKISVEIIEGKIK